MADFCFRWAASASPPSSPTSLTATLHDVLMALSLNSFFPLPLSVHPAHSAVLPVSVSGFKRLVKLTWQCKQGIFLKLFFLPSSSTLVRSHTGSFYGRAGDVNSVDTPYLRLGHAVGVPAFLFRLPTLMFQPVSGDSDVL